VVCNGDCDGEVGRIWRLCHCGCGCIKQRGGDRTTGYLGSIETKVSEVIEGENR